MPLFLYFISFCMIIIFPVIAFNEKEEDFSNKVIVGNFYKPTDNLPPNSQDLYGLLEKLQNYKKEILLFSKKNDPNSAGHLQDFCQKEDLSFSLIKERLEEPQLPSARTVWNEFQHRLKELKISSENMRYLYKSIHPSRKIIEDPNQHLVRARFSGCGIEDEQLVQVLHMLNDCHSLEFLDLSNNALSLRAMKHILGFMSRYPRIRIVDLSKNRFSPEDFQRELFSPMVDMSFQDSNLLVKLIFTHNEEDLEDGGNLSWLSPRWRQNHKDFFSEDLIHSMGSMKIEA